MGSGLRRNSELRKRIDVLAYMCILHLVLSKKLNVRTKTEVTAMAVVGNAEKAPEPVANGRVRKLRRRRNGEMGGRA